MVKIKQRKKILIFVLTIIIVIISIILISIFFSYSIPGKDSNNTTLTVTPTSSSTSEEGPEHQHDSTPLYDTEQKIADAKKNTETNSGGEEKSIEDNYAQKKQQYEKDYAAKFIDIKTISGKPFDPSKLPYHYSKDIVVDVSSITNYKLSLNKCLSTEANNIKYDPKYNTSESYINEVKKALANIDVSYDGNTFDNGIDGTC